jgi:putative endonuclease
MPTLGFAVETTPRSAGRIPGSTFAQIYDLAKAGLRRLLSRIGGIAGLFNAGSDDSRAALGAQGERLAIRRLRRDGYRIVARNYRAAGAEIDVIAMAGDTLVFVEVKTRLGSSAGRPEESVHGLKQHRIRRAAAVYARDHAKAEHPIRFDVVAVSRAAGRWRLEIIKDAF